ncbi:hypothetical protein HDV03_004321 [Kappamyces sp. JEL0829]|nr:hypothetical protein HDV03_004321 [Kappamyces sp. JEL0829]
MVSHSREGSVGSQLDIRFPPYNLASLKSLLNQNLVVVRNVPASLSSDTLCKFLSFYGQISQFQLLASEQDQGRNEAMGLYVELAELPRHEYLIGSCLDHCSFEHGPQMQAAYNASQSSDFHETEKESVGDQDQEDFEFSFQSQEIAKQLITGYAKILATSFLTMERLSDQFGITNLVLYFIGLFSLVDLYQKIYVYLQIQKRVESLAEQGRMLKESMEKRAIGKPLVEQGEQLYATVRDIADQTQKIIAVERRRIKHE